MLKAQGDQIMQTGVYLMVVMYFDFKNVMSEFFILYVYL